MMSPEFKITRNNSIKSQLSSFPTFLAQIFRIRQLADRFAWRNSRREERKPNFTPINSDLSLPNSPPANKQPAASVPKKTDFKLPEQSKTLPNYSSAMSRTEDSSSETGGVPIRQINSAQPYDTDDEEEPDDEIEEEVEWHSSCTDQTDGNNKPDDSINQLVGKNKPSHKHKTDSDDPFSVSSINDVSDDEILSDLVREQTKRNPRESKPHKTATKNQIPKDLASQVADIAKRRRSSSGQNSSIWGTLE